MQNTLGYSSHTCLDNVMTDHTLLSLFSILDGKSTIFYIVSPCVLCLCVMIHPLAGELTEK